MHDNFRPWSVTIAKSTRMWSFEISMKRRPRKVYPPFLSFKMIKAQVCCLGGTLQPPFEAPTWVQPFRKSLSVQSALPSVRLPTFHGKVYPQTIFKAGRAGRCFSLLCLVCQFYHHFKFSSPQDPWIQLFNSPIWHAWQIPTLALLWSLSLIRKSG